MSKKPEFPHGVCLCIAYDGTDFHGWQAQEGLRTVQGTIEEAAAQMRVETTPLLACSRTDAGVHALGQLASFRSRFEVPPQGWIHGLNAVLPRDVVILDAKPCYYRYNPRFHSRSKRYRYLIRCARYRDPLIRNQVWHLTPNYARRDLGRGRHDRAEEYLDLEAMREAARHMVGTHDFHAFRAASDERETSVRTMFSVELLPCYEGRAELLAIEVRGSAFMKNMVRIMVGTLVEVGRGQLTADAVHAMLQPGAERSDAGQTAPARGLSLVEIELARFDGPADLLGRPSKGEPPSPAGGS